MSIVPRPSFSDDSRTVNKQLPKCLLLRDYLLNDMSSCSSNGFRSYPRLPSTTVRFLVEMELNNNRKVPMNQHRPPIINSKTDWKSSLISKQSSMLQRASTLMIKSFKHFSFVRTGNLSRKILKYSLWKKSDHRNNEVKQLKSLGDLLKETEITRHPSQLTLTTVTTTTTTIITADNRNSNSNNNSESWSSSDLTETTTTDSFTTVNSFEVELAQDDVVDDLPEDKKLTEGNRVGATTTAATVTNYSDTTENSKKWQNKQEEQFSPVSVMDFPSDIDNDIDDDDEVSSMFQHRHLEAPKTFRHKGRRFEDVPQVEPVKLEDRIAQSIIESSTQKCSNFAQKENDSEKKAMELLQLTKSTTSHHISEYEEMENLLLDFFKEKIVGEICSDNEMLQIAKDWMGGQAQEMVLEWECPNDRQIYLTEMEEELRWSKYDDEVEKDNMSFELECEIFSSLINDILQDFHF